MSSHQPRQSQPLPLPLHKFHYSLRLNTLSTTPSRTDIPPNTTHLSLDYSFPDDKSSPPNSPHPSLHALDKRLAKHIKYLARRGLKSLRTFKLILLTANCCRDCSEDAIARTFGFFKRDAAVHKLSLTQRALAGLPLVECYSVVAFLDRRGHRLPPREYVPGLVGGMGGRGGKVGGEVEVEEGGSQYGTRVDGLQMETQRELEKCRDWPVVYSWWRWV